MSPPINSVIPKYKMYNNSMPNGEYSLEYLEALNKSVTQPDLTKVETDTPEERTKRAEKELFIREHLSAVQGLSFYERVIFVRENLFDTNVRGDRPSDIRKGNIGFLEGFPEAGYAEAAYPSFVKLVDTLDTFIQELPQDKQQEASLRLASIVYGIGIPLHLFSDGNGQSLRLVALSYIHEYSPNLRDKYFTQRLTTKEPQPIELNYIDHIVNSVGYLENDSIFESHKTQVYVGTLVNSFKSEEARIQVINLYKTYLETGVCSVEEVKNKWIREIFREAVQMFRETEEDIKVKLDVHE